MSLRPRLVNLATAKLPIVITSLDVVECEDDFLWTNGKPLNDIEGQPHLYLIGVRQTAKLRTPLVDYASVMKQILLRSKQPNPEVIIAVYSTHECMPSFFGDRVAKEIRKAAIEVHIRYNVDGMNSICVVLGEDERCFVQMTNKPTVKQFRQVVSEFLEPQFSLYIRREDVHSCHAMWQKLQNFVKSRFDDTVAKCFYDGMAFVCPMAIVNEIRLVLQPNSIPVSKPDRVVYTDSWLDKNTEFRWAYFACIIREFCFVAIRVGLSMDLVRQVVRRYVTAHLFAEYDIDKTIMSAFYSIEKIKRQRAKQ